VKVVDHYVAWGSIEVKEKTELIGQGAYLLFVNGCRGIITGGIFWPERSVPSCTLGSSAWQG
jgi:hypothetical protein